MAILTLGTKQVLVNESAKFPATVSGTGQDAVLRIEGFGRFPVKELVGPIRGVRGVDGTKHKLVITPANITIAGSTPANTLVTVEVDLVSSGLVMEFSRYSETYGKKKRFALKLAANETATGFLRKLHVAIQNEFNEDGFDLITSVENNNATTPANLDNLTIETREKSLFIKGVKFYNGVDNEPSTVVTAFTPTETKATDGVNTYDQLKLVRMLTGVTTEPHSLQGLQLPTPGEKYTSLLFKTAQAVDHVTGNAAAGSDVTASQEFQLFIKEAGNSAYIDTILSALLTKTGITAIYYGKDGASKATKADFLA